MPDPLWVFVRFGEGKKYSDNQAEHMAKETGVFAEFDAWTDAFADLVAKKGKVKPGKYRAFGYEPPGHRWDDLKLKWRAVRMSLGRAKKGSSPRRQERLGLNRDATLRPKKGEGEKLRD